MLNTSVRSAFPVCLATQDCFTVSCVPVGPSLTCSFSKSKRLQVPTKLAIHEKICVLITGIVSFLISVVAQ